MKFVDINLASDPIRNFTPFFWTYGILSGFVVLFLTYNIYAFTRYSGDLSRLKEDHRRHVIHLAEIGERDRVQRREISKWDLTGLSRRAIFANNAIRRRTFSWTGLFNQLEEVLPPRIKLAAIRPNISEEGITIRMDGLAKGHAGFLTFQERLQSSPVFRHVYPGGERRESGKTIIFNLEFDYFPPSPEPLPVTASAEPVQETTGKTPEGQSVMSVEPEEKQPPSLSETAVSAGERIADATLPGVAADPGESPEPEADTGSAPEARPATARPRNLSYPGARRAKAAKQARFGKKSTSDKGGPSAPKIPPVPTWQKEFLVQGETVSAVYRRLARFGKVSIILEEGVNPGKRITAKIPAETFEEGLAKFAEIAGHILRKEGDGIYRVGDALHPPRPLATEEVEDTDLEEDPGRAAERSVEKEEGE